MRAAAKNKLKNKNTMEKTIPIQEEKPPQYYSNLDLPDAKPLDTPNGFLKVRKINLKTKNIYQLKTLYKKNVNLREGISNEVTRRLSRKMVKV